MESEKGKEAAAATEGALQRVALEATEEEVEDDDASEVCLAVREIIVSSLPSSDEAVVEKALEKVYHLASPKLQKYFFCLGGHLAVVQAMNKYPSNMDLQYDGIRVLGWATFGNTEIGHFTAEINGMHAILAAMKNVLANDGKLTKQYLHKEGLKALKSIVDSSEETAARFVEIPDGISAVVNAMKKYSHVEDVVLVACELFCSLLRHSKLRKRIRHDEAQVKTALESAYYSHKDGVTKTTNMAREALKLLWSD